jgi:hypothetical protein
MPYSGSGASRPLSSRSRSSFPPTARWPRWASCWRCFWRSARRGWWAWTRRGVESLRVGAVCGAGGSAAAAGRWLNWAVLRRHPDLAAGRWPWFIIRCWPPSAPCWRPWWPCSLRRWQRLPLWPTADALAAPLALGLAFEQWARSGRLGLRERKGLGVRWAVTYTDPLAARWSGTPLGVALHPVQAYAALAFLTLSILLLFWLPAAGSRAMWPVFCCWARRGCFFHRILARSEGRGALLGGALDGPQAAAVLLVLAGGLALLERKPAGAADAFGRGDSSLAVFPPSRQHETATNGAPMRTGHPNSTGQKRKTEAANG